MIELHYFNGSTKDSNCFRDGKSMGTTLMSNEEKQYMWNLAFFFTIKHGDAYAFKTYYAIRSFITYHGFSWHLDTNLAKIPFGNRFVLSLAIKKYTPISEARIHSNEDAAAVVVCSHGRKHEP